MAIVNTYKYPSVETIERFKQMGRVEKDLSEILDRLKRFSVSVFEEENDSDDDEIDKNSLSENEIVYIITCAVTDYVDSYSVKGAAYKSLWLVIFDWVYLLFDDPNLSFENIIWKLNVCGPGFDEDFIDTYIIN